MRPINVASSVGISRDGEYNWDIVCAVSSLSTMTKEDWNDSNASAWI